MKPIFVNHFLTVSPALFTTFKVGRHLISLDEMPKKIREIFYRVLTRIMGQVLGDSPGITIPLLLAYMVYPRGFLRIVGIVHEVKGHIHSLLKYSPYVLNRYNFYEFLLTNTFWSEMYRFEAMLNFYTRILLDMPIQELIGTFMMELDFLKKLFNDKLYGLSAKKRYDNIMSIFKEEKCPYIIMGSKALCPYMMAYKIYKYILEKGCDLKKIIDIVHSISATTKRGRRLVVEVPSVLETLYQGEFNIEKAINMLKGEKIYHPFLPRNSIMNNISIIVDHKKFIEKFVEYRSKILLNQGFREISRFLTTPALYSAVQSTIRIEENEIEIRTPMECSIEEAKIILYLKILILLLLSKYRVDIDVEKCMHRDGEKCIYPYRTLNPEIRYKDVEKRIKRILEEIENPRTEIGWLYMKTKKIIQIYLKNKYISNI